jgi:hypothetical protein
MIDFLVDALNGLINGWLTEAINQALKFLGSLYTNLIPLCLYAENYMQGVFGGDGYINLTKVFVGIAVMLIIIKFLKKGLDVYVLYQDGDPDMDPLHLLSSFFKAIAMAFCFPVIYDLMAEMTKGLIDAIMTNTNLGATNVDVSNALNVAVQATGGLILGIILIIIFVVMMIGLYLQLLMRGVEVLILKLSFPLACVGIIDADNGIYGSFLKKFIQTMFSIVAQISLAFISIALMMGGDPIWSIAVCMLALKTPQFLSEFMVGGLGGGVSKAMGMTNSGLRLGQSFRSFIGR